MAPLAGVLVADITQGAAGPYCTKLLAELGADVVKVEPPAGDRSRRCGPFPGGRPDAEQSAAFLFRNTGKRSVIADLATAQGRAFLAGLAGRAHVLVADLSPAEEGRLGLDLNGLATANPALILTHVTAYGRSGPYADAPADESLIQALSGFMDLLGLPEREPVRAVGAQASYIGGLAAAVATLAALLRARRGGPGCVVDAAAVEALLALLFGPVMAFSYQGVARSRMGNRSHTYGPLTNVYRCRDGFVTIAVETSRQYETLCSLLRRPHLLETIPWAAARHADELTGIIQGWLATFTRREAFATMQEYRIPVGMVLTPAEVLADPQCAARRFFVSLDHPAAGRLLYPGSPYDTGDFWHVARAPLLGEHGAEVRAMAGPHPPAPSPNPERGRERLPSPRIGADAERPGARGGGRQPRAGGIGPLHGLRILDLTMVWAGPFGAQLLADLGAEVIKIEAVQRLDMARWGATADNRADAHRYNAGGAFHTLNRNKLGVTLNLATEDGREALLRLAERSDGLIENYSRRVMDNFGLGFPVLHAANPRLVMVSMPGYGAVGPYRDYVSFGEVLEGMAGIAALTGYPDGPPLRHGIAYLDPVGGYHGALALLAGLHERERTGLGQHIVLAQRDAGVRLVGELLLAAQMDGCGPVRTGNADPARAPHGVYPAQGHPSWLALSVPSDEAWRALCAVMGRPNLAAVPAYATGAGRTAHRAELDAAVAAWTRTLPARAAAARLAAAGVPAAPVNAVDTLCDDPHLVAREAFVPADHPEAGRRTIMAAPFLLDGQRPPVRFPAPNLGQHNERVLGALPGFDPDRLRAMAAAGIIGDEPL